MNRYTTTFMVKCPVNKKIIRYTLTIEAHEKILVEDILQGVDALPSIGFHEDIADKLEACLLGRHLLRAHHHGVDIETVRENV